MWVFFGFFNRDFPLFPRLLNLSSKTSSKGHLFARVFRNSTCQGRSIGVFWDLFWEVHLGPQKENFKKVGAGERQGRKSIQIFPCTNGDPVGIPIGRPGEGNHGSLPRDLCGRAARRGGVDRHGDKDSGTIQGDAPEELAAKTRDIGARAWEMLREITEIFLWDLQDVSVLPWKG